MFVAQGSQPSCFLFHIFRGSCWSALISIDSEWFVLFLATTSRRKVFGERCFRFFQGRVNVIHPLREKISPEFSRHDVEMYVRNRLPCSSSVLRCVSECVLGLRGRICCAYLTSYREGITTIRLLDHFAHCLDGRHDGSKLSSCKVC